MHTQAVQDYLKTIYKLEEESEKVSTTSIANDLGVSGASVTGMLKRLSQLGLVDYNSYKGVRLTKEGIKESLAILRNHRLLEMYLRVELNFPLENIHDEACRLEHQVSVEFVDRIDAKLGFPKFDPHGHPIPTKDGSIPDVNELQLSLLDPGIKVKIARLSDFDNEMLAYFEKMDLMPKEVLEIIEKAPFNGPITIKRKSGNLIIGNEIAKNIFVENPVK